MAGFSSWGPTHGDLLIKPDVSAPGADVLSSVPANACSAPPCWAFFGGTSMATPHLAGAAAVVRGIHPDWSAAEVRSAIVNTAQQGVLRHPETGDGYQRRADRRRRAARRLRGDEATAGAGPGQPVVRVDLQRLGQQPVQLDPDHEPVERQRRRSPWPSPTTPPTVCSSARPAGRSPSAPAHPARSRCPWWRRRVRPTVTTRPRSGYDRWRRGRARDAVHPRRRGRSRARPAHAAAAEGVGARRRQPVDDCHRPAVTRRFPTAAGPRSSPSGRAGVRPRSRLPLPGCRTRGGRTRRLPPWSLRTARR